MNKLNYLITLPVLALSLMGCSFNPFGVGGLQALNMSTDFSSLGEENKISNPYAVLSAEEVLKGFSSVTNVSPNTAIMNEYNARNSILATSNDLKEVTAPMMIAVANLSGEFCNALYQAENGTAPKRIYASVNLTGNLNNFSDEQYVELLESMSMHFWSRQLTGDERRIMQAAKNEFYETLTPAQRGQTASLRNFLLFTCSAMLSSFDSIVL